MACESCMLQSRTLLQAAIRNASPSTRYAARMASKSFNHDAAAVLRTNAAGMTMARQSRQFSSSPSRRFLGGMSETYQVLGATERLAKDCMAQADYSITKEQRKNDEVEVLADGEEVGKPLQPDNIWHRTFGLKPSFSTWSHVSMLHIYLLNTRLRCFERDEYRNWHQQLIDHFFFECEKKMHVDHNITSSALRQRYLKDIFTQFRGLLLAYDEGLVKGDAILASALWRNLFKGTPDVDPRALAAIVGWMRKVMQSLEGLPDSVFAADARKALLQPVERHWLAVAGGSGAQEPSAASANADAATAESHVPAGKMASVKA